MNLPPQTLNHCPALLCYAPLGVPSHETAWLLTRATKAQCAAVNLPPPTRLISPRPDCSPDLTPSPFPFTLSSCPFSLQGPNESAWLCLSGLLSHSIQRPVFFGKGRGVRAVAVKNLEGMTPSFGERELEGWMRFIAAGRQI